MTQERVTQVCVCHDTEMRWHKDGRLKVGGYWRCVVKHREAQGRYEGTVRGQQRHHRYEMSAAGRLRKQLHELGRLRFDLR